MIMLENAPRPSKVKSRLIGQLIHRGQSDTDRQHGDYISLFSFKKKRKIIWNFFSQHI
jgi:hypothetical protein